ncbi:MAG: class I SAM-dependent methyltransferase [Thermodesulfobacteriota bacterium]
MHQEQHSAPEFWSPDQETVATLCRYVDLRQKHVLEIGCGDGRLSTPLREVVHRLVGVEPSFSDLLRSRQRCPKWEAINASGQALPFQNRVFDAVVFSLSLHHHPDCALALDQAAAAVAPGGVLMALEPEYTGELSQVCTVFQDEREDLEAAQDAVARWPNRWHFQVPTQWTFAGPEALAQWVFAYYAQPYDVAAVDQMLARLGPRTRLRPLVVDDPLVCWVLHVQ